MNILIFEYITGGGMIGQDLSSSLVKEGELMLNAVANDFAAVSSVHVNVLRDYRLRGTGSDASRWRNKYIADAENSFHAWIERLGENIDALLIIAPESGNILTTLCEQYSKQDYMLLNSTIESIALTTDKLETYKYLKQFSIPQISTHEMTDIASIISDRLIIKPKEGVGCENISLCATEMITDDTLNTFSNKDYIVQPYVQGQHASLSLLCCNGECSVLTANRQNIVEIENRLYLKECVVNALQREEFIEFSKNLIQALPGLKGYIGVDILLRENEVLLVEINPRLTTSYVGLRSALGVNPAELILHTFIHQELPTFTPSADECVTVLIGAECAA
jgi:predicted ATP-grasp superfamily ATP-dependent carboligase